MDFVAGLILGKICIGICSVGTGTTVVQCPTVREWTPEFQQMLRAELASAPRRKALTRVVGDAIQDRDIARACSSK